MSWYEILNVDIHATPDIIKKSYRQLILIHHPDKGGNEEDFKRIQDAFESTLTPNSTPFPHFEHPCQSESEGRPTNNNAGKKPRTRRPKEKKEPEPKPKKPIINNEDNPRCYEYYSKVKHYTKNMPLVFEELINLRRCNGKITNRVLGALIRLRGLSDLKTTDMSKQDLISILFLDITKFTLKNNIAILNIKLDGTENKQLLIEKLLTG